jgi:hypothetical protein
MDHLKGNAWKEPPGREALEERTGGDKPEGTAGAPGMDDIYSTTLK